MNALISAIRARLLTIAVWAVIILVIVGLVSANRATLARQTAALSSTDENVRDGMVLQLVQSGRLIDALTNTQDPNSDADSPQNQQSLDIRKNAAISVNHLIDQGKIPTQQAMNTLFLLCKDANADVKATAKTGLKKVGEQSDSNLHDVVGRLKDGDPDIRSAAVDVLGQIGGDAAFGDKTAQYVDAVILDPTSQDSAESAMKSIGPPAVPYLEKHLADPKMTLDFRQKMADLLGQIGAASAVPALKQAAETDQPSVRRMALVSLADIVLSAYTAAQNDSVAAQKAAKDPTAKPADVQKAQDAAKKAASDFALSRQAEPDLTAALQNTATDSEARSQAALALGRIASPAATRALIATLGDYDTRVQQAALAGVQEVGPPAVGPLTTALTQGDEQVRASAAEALGGI
ncbi:MAG: HEAT repeat domain-containing protein, partial [Armatimonadetes bacterium]|nr:HEAT repeat domain-containing protein [Armatimonadota bacterium]